MIEKIGKLTQFPDNHCRNERKMRELKRHTQTTIAHLVGHKGDGLNSHYFCIGHSRRLLYLKRITIHLDDEKVANKCLQNEGIVNGEC